MNGLNATASEGGFAPLPTGAGDPSALKTAGGLEFKGAWTIITWIALASITVVPFTNLFLPGTGNKYSVMSILWLLLIFCILIAPSFLKRGFSPILGWMATLFAIRYIYGWMMSTFPEQMADSTRNMIRPMLWAWLLSAVMREDRLRRLGCNIYIFTCASAALLHLLGVGADATFGSQGMERVSAFQLNANALGVIYTSGFLFAFARTIQPRTGYGTFSRFIFAGAGILNLIGMNLTGSRTAAVFTVLGSLFLVGLELHRAKVNPVGIAISVVLVLAGWGLASTHSVVTNRAGKVASRKGLENEDRARMAPILVEQFLRSPIYGLGPENYRLELGNRSGTGEPGVGIVAHNQLLMFAVELGLMGLIPFFSMCLCLIWHAWRLRFEEGALPIALALPCILTAWATTNIAFHWHFHFIVAYVAAAMGASRLRGGPAFFGLQRSHR